MTTPFLPTHTFMNRPCTVARGCATKGYRRVYFADGKHTIAANQQLLPDWPGIRALVHSCVVEQLGLHSDDPLLDTDSFTSRGADSLDEVEIVMRLEDALIFEANDVEWIPVRTVANALAALRLAHARGEL